MALTFFWTQNPELSVYTLQLVGLFVFLFFGLQTIRRSRKITNPSPTLDLINAIILSVIILLLVLSTGGLKSPLFFLVYFLLFGISWSLGPDKSIVLSVFLLMFFLLNSEISFEQTATLLSLVMITPLSVYFGSQYLKINAQKKKLKKEEKELTNDETNILMWLSLNFIPAMTGIIDDLSTALSNTRLTATQKQSLDHASQTAKKIMESGEYLKEKVDLESDE